MTASFQCMFEINHHDIFNESSWSFWKTNQYISSKRTSIFYLLKNRKVSWINQIQIIGIRCAEYFFRVFANDIFHFRLLNLFSQSPPYIKFVTKRIYIFHIWSQVCMCQSMWNIFKLLDVFSVCKNIQREKEKRKCKIECIPPIGKFSVVIIIRYESMPYGDLRWICVKKWRSHFAIS